MALTAAQRAAIRTRAEAYIARQYPNADAAATVDEWFNIVTGLRARVQAHPGNTEVLAQARARFRAFIADKLDAELTAAQRDALLAHIEGR